MVGGGSDAFIGAVHRSAARMDGHFVLAAGCFSADPAKSAASGEALGLPPERVYADFRAMAEAEAALPAEERIDAVAVVTPNHLHVPVADCFLGHGFHVICDKPLSDGMEAAQRLAESVADSGRIFALTHNYSGYPMVKEARQRVREGALGTLRKVVVEYPQDWLRSPLERDNQKQASWRTNPEMAGQAGCIGDIGTHAEHLVRYITGLEIEALCADFSTFVEGRALEDDGNFLLRFRGGAKGVLYASQISTGEENHLKIRVYGTDGGLEWCQEAPNALYFTPAGQPRQRLTRASPYLGEAASSAGRLPPGHPEGFIEAFANLYAEVARAIRDFGGGSYRGTEDYDFPTIEDGLAGMRFIGTAVRSAASEEKWTRMPE